MPNVALLDWACYLTGESKPQRLQAAKLSMVFRFCAVTVDIVSVRSLLSVCTCFVGACRNADSDTVHPADVKPVLSPNLHLELIFLTYPQTPTWKLDVNKNGCQQQKLATKKGQVKAKAFYTDQLKLHQGEKKQNLQLEFI